MQNSTDIWHYRYCVYTCIRSSLLVADVTDSDRDKTPASLRDRNSFGRAAIAEALTTGTAVMLGVVVLEDCMTLIAHLVQEKNNKTIKTEAVIDQELEEKGSKSIQVLSCDLQT